MKRDPQDFIIVIVAALTLFVLWGILTTESKNMESWTTMYFENHTKDVRAFEAFPLSFTVESHETGISEYFYEVVLEFYENEEMVKAQRVANGTIVLSPGEDRTVVEELKVEELFPYDIKVKVDLYREGFEGVYRDIHYWTRLA